MAYGVLLIVGSEPISRIGSSLYDWVSLTLSLLFDAICVNKKIRSASIDAICVKYKKNYYLKETFSFFLTVNRQ